MTVADDRSSNPRPTFRGRLLAEAVRAAERDGAAPRPSEPIPARGDLESRVVARAAAVDVAPALEAAIDRARGVLRTGLVVLLVLAAIAGGAAAAAAVGTGDGGPVNLLEIALTLLVPQIVLLAVWAILTIIGPQFLAGSPLLHVPRLLLRALVRRGRRVDPETATAAAGTLDDRTAMGAAATALAAPLARPRIARATAGVLPHAAWTVFNLGAIVTLLVLFAVREYRFTWETTSLRPETAERLVGVIVGGPELVGLGGPGEETLARARNVGAGGIGGGEQGDEDRRAFARLVVAMIGVYGLAPRLLLLAMCWAWLGTARRGWRLNLDRPGYARLAAELMPDVRPEPAVSETGRLPSPAPLPEADEPDEVAEGDPMIVRLEWEPGSAWPPPLPGLRWTDLGTLDGREDRRRVPEAISAADPPPSRVVVVVDLAVTPDRGHEHVLAQLRGDGDRAVRLVLTGGHDLFRRAGAESVAGRTSVWRTAAARIGLGSERIIECDLDHATGASLDALAAFLSVARTDQDLEASAIEGARGAGPELESHLDSALDLIVEAAASWRTVPDAAAESELHRAIQRRYRAGARGLASLFDVRGAETSGAALFDAAASTFSDPGSRLERVRAAADAFAGRLPSGLRRTARWSAAGAAAGACGCVAAAALVSPLAIAAIPAWTTIGGAIAGLLAAARSTGNDDSAETGEPTPGGGTEPDVALGAIIDGAVLTVLVLELQGRDEPTVARVLERTLADLPTCRSIPGDAASVRRHVDLVRERFDAALATDRVDDHGGETRLASDSEPPA